MKALNTVKFIAEATKNVETWKDMIRYADTYETAKKAASRLIGYLDCLVTFNNTMICKENNDFTAAFDDLLNEWHAEVYGLLADKAIHTGQSADLIAKLFIQRDEILAA